ncbi:hypothetical protein OOZ15_01345 [Galbibacter sp. EGI 63066]|uniref:hypothetical protein n=1 Tax=Galbibacter sp. EGI 63066 TaxID=2993559 RepID=UPI002248DD8E|nr:hypothetical protein [Galbibacter sp. EGI 63066]MCX2678576.1 hypothetical protein [Galbibacter sp. EGI 63066]
MSSKILPPQPNPVISYLRVGKLLYLSLALFVLESLWYWAELQKAWTETSVIIIVFWLWSFLFSFIHIYLVLMDGLSRYQNYKRAKDQFYMYGFKKRIAETYISSKCQRMAAKVAAQELGMEDEIKKYYTSRGVKWYHYIPYFMVKEPFFLFKKSFWCRTFLEKNYKPKIDFKNLQLESSL